MFGWVRGAQLGLRDVVLLADDDVAATFIAFVTGAAGAFQRAAFTVKEATWQG